ncbi:MAG: hypothetical protein A2902_06925 [Elusimicrobia bacterium RIFCSPLOWO2_01_FULL_64_13]|nr:MAG: hypothetical protein A2636_04150 [Elusimicrobia bacterium RIFCSPHIGHO2_01_FULL_64_10]OGR97466.1 MAG: hypothetical protein A2902_06925 [Elusimicrobia bacterium RIFCSPLOWO2_01_FULL_64_13]
MDSTAVRSAAFFSRIFLGILFIFSGIGKVIDVPGFAVAVSDYGILPAVLVRPFAFLVAWTELAAGLMLIFGAGVKWAAGTVAVLMGVFFIAAAVGLARGLDIDCGCFDIPLFGPSKLGWHVLARDAVLGGLALLVSFARKRSDG